MNKKIPSMLLAIILALCALTGCSGTVDEPCMYCGNSPSKEYKKQDGTPVYVCEKCSSECMICGEKKATKHYESLMGIVFACDDCYKMAKAG